MNEAPSRWRRLRDSDITHSFLTSPGAMLAAVVGQASGRNVHLIAGGDAKGLSFDGMSNEMSGSVKQLLLIGRDSDRLAESLKELSPVNCETLDNAVARATEMAGDGDVVLLAPGCASSK